MRLAEGAESVTKEQLVSAFKQHRTGYTVAAELGISYQTLRTLLARFLKQGFDVRAKAKTPAKVGHPVVHGRAVDWRKNGRPAGYQAPSETPEARKARKLAKLEVEKKEAARKKRAAKKRAAKS